MSNEILGCLVLFDRYSYGYLRRNQAYDYRIEQLEKKVDKHNNLIERTAVIENTIKIQGHRIDNLEHLTKKE